MQIYDALLRDHDKLKPLLNELVSAGELDYPTRKTLVAKVREELIPHARAEEAVFYNSLRAIDETRGLVAHSYLEHAEAEILLAALQGMEAVDGEWKRSATKLQKAVFHHIEDEEGRVFEAAKQVLAPEEAQMMAEVFWNLKPKFLGETFIESTAELLVNLMPARFTAPFRAYIHQMPKDIGSTAKGSARI